MSLLGDIFGGSKTKVKTKTTTYETTNLNLEPVTTTDVDLNIDTTSIGEALKGFAETQKAALALGQERFGLLLETLKKFALIGGLGVLLFMGSRGKKK